MDKNKENKKYNQLNFKDLVMIEMLYKEEYSQWEIAVKIWKNKSTISRLFTKYKVKENWSFDSEIIWKDIKENKIKDDKQKHFRILKDSELEKFILEKIVISWSPEQIAWVWKKEKNEVICHETIYKYFYENKPEMIKIYFRRKWKKYQTNRKEKYQIKDRRMIEERPEEVEDRKQIWHWEWDTIIWKDHKWAIITNVERKTWFLIASKIESKDSHNLALTTIEDFKEIPDRLKLTMTYDNWREFACHKIIEENLSMTIYFANAYSPWERWTNENTNWLLREFIPKWTDFSNITQEQLDNFVNLINERPRKRLWFYSPKELFFNEFNEIKKVALDNGM